MATTQLEFGHVVQLVQNQIYAMPTDAVAQISQAESASFDISNDPTFSVFITVTGSQIVVGRAYLRCTTGNVLLGIVRAG